MTERYPYDDGLGSWLSSGLKATVQWVAGKGNRPGTPETREFGYDRQQVANAVVAQITGQPAADPAAALQSPLNIAAPASAQANQLILLGAAGIAALLVLSGGHRKAKRK